MSEREPVVFVIDDDPSVRKSLYRLLTVSGYQVKTFSSAQEFLPTDHSYFPSCLVLDVRLPGLDGLELQKALTDQGARIPIIFITGHGDIPMSVKAMKAGAIDFLSKPFSAESLLDAVAQAIDKSRLESTLTAEIAETKRRLDLLTPRELEVMRHVISGQLNKQIAVEIGLSEKTIKVHRGHAMRKLKAQSIAQMVRMLEKFESYQRQSGTGL